MTLVFNKSGLLTDNMGSESRNIKVGFIIENSLHYQIFRKMHVTDKAFIQIGFMSFWHNRNFAPTGAIFRVV